MGKEVMKKLAILVLLVLLGGLTPSWGAEPDAGNREGVAAKAVVERLHEVLLSCMREGDALGFQGRYDRIAATLDETFDLSFMARLSLGADWKGLDEEQRAEFTGLSRRLSASSYADNFSGYGGQRFETLSDEPAAHGTILVKTVLVQPKDKDVKLDYRLRRYADRCRIIDIRLDGKVSEITLRRADYRSVIQRDGFVKLVEMLEEKIEELSSE
jgi:phospholipid transport system substrate-binding protein